MNNAATPPKGLNSLYRRPVVIDRDKHSAWRIAPLTRFGFAASIQALPVTVSEFKEAHKEFPLVFARGPDKKLVPVVLLGLRKNENIYVRPDGNWDARYLPAYLRRYPFIFSEAGGDRLALCVDEACDAVGTETGEPLFEQGKESAFLKRILEFMSAYQNDYRLTGEFCKHVEDLGVLTQMSAQAEMKTGEKYVISNFLMVDEAKLRAIDSVSVGRLFQSGELALLYAHLMSLSNLGRLTDLLAARSR